MRQFFCTCWDKYRQKQPLEPLESQIVAVINEHPEYQTLLANPELAKQKEYLPELNETNPFLHMSMHLSIREQISINQPPGINELISRLNLKYGSHEAEHQVMDCLAEVIWQAQRNGAAPDNLRYLECLKEKSRG